MIVPVTAENEAVWAELCAALWPHHPVEDFLRERRGGALQDEFLFCAEGEAVGFISLSLRRDYVQGTSSSPVGYIEGIYVKPECRGQGIARELVEFAGQWSRGQGCAELASDCQLANESSRAFHNRVGFREMGTIVCFAMRLS